MGCWCLYCDYFWSELSDLRYALYGGECNVRASCGTSCLNLYCTPKVGGWAVGACCDYTECLNDRLCYPEFGGRNGWGPNPQFGMFLICCVYPATWFRDIVGACCDYAFSNPIGSFYGWVGLSAWYGVPYAGLSCMTVSWVDGAIWTDIGASYCDYWMKQRTGLAVYLVGGLVNSVKYGIDAFGMFLSTQWSFGDGESSVGAY